ncbi:hypothetical protein FEDK69T_00310 [Flavobacterium enshiense DK69]|uniref:DUF4856 domain-containing protein n=1 Tax=Flavobacterium enshiense DK69 TaxID=1107311 RepID=V6SFC0_9FLAO|nr:DUF4856 domain-containing protein [Flavobacterium enshiense]ESU25266.1 hypothetical protein FEDK69T_00310 [Flavobacterium enshiense DK69]KGO93170.1 hypothetical protein Q767_15025 [Flavobacterium enshiense DK69]
MKFKNVLLASLPVAALFSVSCSNDDNNTSQEQVFNYTVPTTYAFERSGESTVDYAGQTNRVLMLDEMGTEIKNKAAAGTVLDAAKLSDMYNNVNSQFSNVALNTATDKQLKNKTAASRDFFVNFNGGATIAEQTAVRNLFQAQFDNAAAASGGEVAAAGVAGTYIDGNSKRLFAANGLEPQQVLLKGMMGACFMDQIVNNYLSKNVLDEGSNRENNTNKVLEEGKNYTKMEHLWDEAYGYIYGGDDLTGTSPVLKFWSSYIKQVDDDSDFGSLREDIELAFRKGRAAITAGDYATRDTQIAIIKKKIALVPAVRAVFYLKEGKGKLATDSGAKAFHALSEGYGFIMSLRYTNRPGTNSPYMTKAEVDAILSGLTAGTNGLWDVDYLNDHIDGWAEQIATRFGFTVAQAETVTP